MLNLCSYKLIRKNKQNLSLRIDQLGKVCVEAPLKLNSNFIDNFVLSKLHWIYNTQKKIKTLCKTPQAKSLQELNKQKIIARSLIIERLSYFNNFYQFNFSKIAIKKMTSRWGSCSNKGNLNFNYRLVYLPIKLVDYVVVHELCHLKEHNHGEKFWLEVEKTIPDYKKIKKTLKNHVL